MPRTKKTTEDKPVKKTTTSKASDSKPKKTTSKPAIGKAKTIQAKKVSAEKPQKPAVTASKEAKNDAEKKKTANKAEQAKAASPLAKAKKKQESNEPYVYVEKPDTERISFENALKKAGYVPFDAQGVVMVLVPDDTYEDDIAKVREIREQAGFRKSFGVAKKSNKTYSGKASSFDKEYSQESLSEEDE